MFYLVFNYFGLFSIIYFHSSTATGLAILLLTTSFVLFLIFAHTTHIKKHSIRNNFIPDLFPDLKISVHQRSPQSINLLFLQIHSILLLRHSNRCKLSFVILKKEEKRLDRFVIDHREI